MRYLTGFIAALTIAGSAHAASPTPRQCVEFASTAAEVMNMRQLGIPPKETLRRIEPPSIPVAASLSSLVDQAYSEPRLTLMTRRHAAVRNFQERAYSYCNHYSTYDIR